MRSKCEHSHEYTVFFYCLNQRGIALKVLAFLTMRMDGSSVLEGYDFWHRFFSSERLFIDRGQCTELSSPVISEDNFYKSGQRVQTIKTFNTPIVQTCRCLLNMGYALCIWESIFQVDIMSVTITLRYSITNMNTLINFIWYEGTTTLL